MFKKARFGVLGCGNISKIHIQGIMNTEEAELAAVCDTNKENLKEYVETYGVRAFNDYSEMLKQDDIDVICICTPSGLHPLQTIMAAEAKKHVICEKPLSFDVSDIDRMIESCKDNGVLLAAIFPWRMSPVMQYVKCFIDEGGLGKLSLCSAHIKPFRAQEYYDSASWRGTWAMDGGGVLMNQGIHTIDLLQWFAGPAASLYAKCDNVLRDIEVEDTAVTVLHFKNGAMGVIEASTTAYKTPDTLHLHGEKGTIVLTAGEITNLSLIDQEEVEIPAFEPFNVIPDGHRMQIRNMALAVLEGMPIEVTGEDGRHGLEIILGTYESERTKQEVQLT
ncbi:Gfo/Idh/MocA family oxidoreductase [Paenibacillus sp. HB172176]|uniref:Gfo/Idh/MocA family protein n=1 Tax=Paenibacillus sp. HB172176 TaxID=2493690 RepID=UPI00143B574B|nr:Gfo/Idh/MocA family oxidoreductase [Paenibacillus sp. HB172176]